MANENKDNNIPSKKKIDIFKCIYFIFNLCLIFSFPTCKRKPGRNRLLKCLVSCIGILISIMHFILTVLHIISSHAQPASIAIMFGMLAAVWHRVALSWKLDSLKKLSDKLTKLVFFPIMKKKRRTLNFLICVIFTVLSNISFSILVTCTNFQGSSFSSAVNINFDNSIFHTIKSFLFFTSTYIFIIMPVHIFAILYSLICCYLLDLFDNLKNIFEDNRNVDYAKLIFSLHIIEEKVTLVNELLDIFVFKVILFNVGSVYFAITILLHLDTYENYLQVINSTTLCFFSIFNFMFMMISGIRVNDRSAQVMKIARKLPHASSSDIVTQLRFQFEIQKGSYLKAWGTGTIKRSFILKMFGTIFTYCLLIDGIWITTKEMA